MNIKISRSQCALRVRSIYVATFATDVAIVLAINQKPCGGHLRTPFRDFLASFCRRMSDTVLFRSVGCIQKNCKH